jgi:PAS domain S-box-containing protein
MSHDHDVQDLESLQARLAEAEDTLRAIRAGEVDAVVVEGDTGDQVFTLRSAEQPYRHLVEQMREGAVMLTPEGDILYANRRFAALVGVPLDVVIGGPIARYLPSSGREALASLAASRGGQRRGELLASDGRCLDVYLSLAVTVADGIEQHNVIVADISALVDAETRRRRAESDSHAKDEFMAMLAHELRNPLGAISSAVQVLEALEHADPRVAQAHGVIGRQAGHLARLLDDLLDLGRAITGKIALHRQRLDLAGLIERSMAEFDAAGRNRVLDVSTTPVWVEADPVRVEQILGNLVGNAVKYTQPGGRIRVTLEGDADEAVLTVEDDGLGISDDLMPRIFDLFVQGDRTIDRSQGGLGLGLTLVQRLVELHGGSITAASGGAGHGSAFTVRLPRAHGSDHAAAAADAAAAAPSSPCRVLVVEDNPDVRTMLQAALELEGHEVIAAEDGRQALARMEAEHADVALVDLGLPGMDGYELARRLRQGRPGIPLVALSGYGLPEDRERSKRAGFNHHLVKPADPAVLGRIISSLAGTAR